MSCKHMPPPSLDMTVTYDYSCEAEGSDSTKSMEELSGLFSFTVGEDNGSTLSFIPLTVL